MPESEIEQLGQFSDAQARDFWTSVYNNQQAGIIILRNGITIHTNDAGVKIAGGNSPDKFIGLLPAEAFVTSEFKDLVQQSLQQLNQSGKSIPPTEIRINCVNGEQKDLLISATSWQEQGTTLVEATFFDITVFKNRERLLQTILDLNSIVLQHDLVMDPKKTAASALQVMSHLYAEKHNCGFISLDIDNSFLKEIGVMLSEKGPLVASREPLPEASANWILNHLDSDIRDAAKNRRGFRIPISDATWGHLYLSPFFLGEALYGFMFWLFPTDPISSLIEHDDDRRDTFLKAAVASMTTALAQQSRLQQAANLAVLYQLVRELSKKSTLHEIAETTLELIEKEKGWCPSFLRFQTRANQPLETVVYRDCLPKSPQENQEKKRRLDSLVNGANKGITAYIVQTGMPLRSLDLQSDPHYVEIEPGLNYGIFAPIIIDTKSEGVIGVESSDYKFTDEDLQFLCSVAEIVGIGIRAFRLIDVLQERLKWLEVLHTLNQQIGVDTEPEKLYQILVDAAQEAVHAESTALLIYNPATDQLEKAAAHGWMSLVFQNPLKPWQSITGHVFSTGRTYCSPKTLEDPYLLARNREFIPSNCSNIGVPVKGEKGMLGVFHVAVKESTTITKELLDFVEMFGAYCGIVIGRSQQIQEVYKARNQITQAYDETLKGWARALGYRDNETFEHTERVTELSVALGKALGLGEHELENLRRGAILHDIGKIGTPDTILRKPGAHTTEEQAIMRTHAAFAYELLKPIDFLKEAVVVPYCHHEHWDGTGYPRGLKGEEIPLLARIFTVADVYDAVTSDRPYRAAWPKEQALDYMRSQSGKIFDPHIVEVFLSLIETQ
ncbi:MAG TPA: HD domain-containing protein [Spirochaetales bacterium]|nr:HD domain-containing protein [Spirochaetales bacterium]